MTKIMNIEGIGPVFAAKLQEVGIKSVEALLKAGAQPKGRLELAEKAGISKDLILEWVNHADLYRVKGVGEEYSDLLEEAGVDTVVELATRNPENLFKKIMEVNEEKKLVRRPPSHKMVEDWVHQAKDMPRGVFY
jgi:predicted flap endonuclease-1-like 5' DNA nuclease